mmetsp:Transcript_42692/g.49971  ORF Transcript_42692/g.49971 Transcript_42692/m.49971 type:complete len:189 (-) Transcript_42692:30-596(-)
MWIVENKNADITRCFKALCQNTGLRELISQTESTFTKLYNIFCSSYTIKNSFDIHFIIDGIDELNKASSATRDGLVAAIEEVFSRTEESFNPFIEVSQTEEKAFATTETQDRLNEAIAKVSAELSAVHDKLSARITDWLSKKSAPELLNLEAKQQVLKQKLKWEKMLSSKDKLRKLKKAIRTFKHKRR